MPSSARCRRTRRRCAGAAAATRATPRAWAAGPTLRPAAGTARRRASAGNAPCSDAASAGAANTLTSLDPSRWLKPRTLTSAGIGRSAMTMSMRWTASSASSVASAPSRHTSRTRSGRWSAGSTIAVGDRLGHRVGDADPERRRPLRRLVAHRVLQRVAEREDLVRVAGNPPAQLGKLEPASRPAQKLGAERVLELAQLTADRLRRHVKRARSRARCCPRARRPRSSAGACS